MIRPAVEGDMPRLLEMAMRFYPMTSYWKISKMELDIEYVSALILGMIENGIVNVAEVDNKVIGMIGLIVMPFLFNPKYTTAGEIIWWVEPEFWNGGIGRELLQSVTERAKEKGIHTVQMIGLVESPIQAGQLYESEGYNMTEGVWTKVI
jgi:RimJ/RimL family protein N-acetyltransferase